MKDQLHRKQPEHSTKDQQQHRKRRHRQLELHMWGRKLNRMRRRRQPEHSSWLLLEHSMLARRCIRSHDCD